MNAQAIQGRLNLAALILLGLSCFAAASAAEIAPADKRSGYAFMTPETKAMQDDDKANPGMLWVLDGEALWNAHVGAANQSCADCHGKAESMKGVAARYPAFDTEHGQPIDLEQRINLCRVNHQRATPLKWESKELLALTAFVGKQSRVTPIPRPVDERLRPFIEAGRALFELRQGQLNISCSQCHDDNWGKRLAGNIVPQAHPTGYPEYRLEWQDLGSLQRRLRNCLFGMRAEAFSYGAPELVNLELFLMARSADLPIETPAVRP